MRNLFLLLLILISYASIGQDYQSAYQADVTTAGKTSQVSFILRTPDNGYLYAMSHTGTMTLFGQTFNLTDASYGEAKIIKVSSSFTYQWSITVRQRNVVAGSGLLKFDKDSTYAYYFAPYTADTIYVGDKKTSNTFATKSDMSLSKIRVSDGSVRWCRRVFGGSNNQLNYFMSEMNRNDVIYVSFASLGVTDFLGHASVTPYSLTIRQNYIAQLDSAGNTLAVNYYRGTAAATTFRSTNYYNGKLYIAGKFTDSLYVGSYALKSNTSAKDDGIIFCIDTTLTAVDWVRVTKGTAGVVFWQTSMDNAGSSYISGYYTGDIVSVDSTASVLSVEAVPKYGSDDVIIQKYNSSGTLQWMRYFGSATQDKAFNSSVGHNKFFVLGEFTNTMSNYTGDQTKYGAAGDQDVWFCVYDSLGSIVWSTTAGSTVADNVNSCDPCVTHDSTIAYSINTAATSISFGAFNFTNASATTTDSYLLVYGCSPTTVYASTDSLTNYSTLKIAVSSDASPYTCLWSTGSVIDNTQVTGNGIYTVAISDNDGCVYNQSYNIGSTYKALKDNGKLVKVNGKAIIRRVFKFL